MPIHRCCVEGCKSRKPQVKLFNLPTNDALREIWIQHLMRQSPALQDILTKESLIQRKVCILHFEDKYLIGDKRKRLSCPTLFSEEEILSRKPSSPIEFSFEKVQLYNDHSYSFQSENTPGPAIQQQLYHYEVGDITLRLKHVTKDHTYSLNKSKPHIGYTIKTTQSADANPAALSLTKETPKIPSEAALQSHLNEEKSDCDDDNEILIEGVFDLEPDVTKRLDGPFTWQQKPYVFRDDPETVSDDESSIDNIFPRKESPLTEPRNISTDDPEPLTEHTDYVCNECNIAIYGARYKCVQCADYDVCVECEARGVHAAHYVLRVPRGSPQDQVRRVIDAIKRCLEENEPEIMIPEVEEIKDETPDVEECDPLHAFDDQQVPKPGDIAIHQEDRAQHARLKTNASSSITHQTATNVIPKTDNNILTDSYTINHSDSDLANPNNTYYLLDTNDTNILQEIDTNVVSYQTDNNVTAETNTYFLYENVLYQTGPTLINQTSTNVTDQTGTNLITQTGSNEIDLTGTKEVDQFGANITYKSDTYTFHSLKTTDALPQVILDSSDISHSSKPLNQKLVPVRKTHLHSLENSGINPLTYKKRVITPVKRDIRGNLLLNKLP